MEIALINDTHFGIRQDAAYMLDYQEKFYKYEFFPTLYKLGIKNILHGGDLLDRRKYVNYHTLYRMKKMFLDPAAEQGIKIDIIPGNHDVYHKNTNEINGLRELLYGYDNINIIENPKVLNFENDVDILMVPWINNQNYEEFISKIQDTKANYLYGHLELSGFEMHAGQKNEHGMDPNIFKKFVEVWSGHFHHRSQKGNIRYLGAPHEFNWLDYNDERGFHTFDTKTKQLTFHKNSFTLYEKIYYNDETTQAQKQYTEMDVSVYTDKINKLFVIKKNHPAVFEYFVDRIYKTGYIDFSIQDQIREIGDNSENSEFDLNKNSTQDLIHKYVDEIPLREDISKDKIKELMNNYYVESMHLVNKE